MPAQLNSNYEFPTTNARIFHYPRPLTNTELFRMGRGLQQLLEEYFDRQLLKYMVRKLLALY